MASLLPEIMQEPSTDPNTFTMMIHGDSGVGKTSFIADLSDEVLMCDTENGALLQKVHRVAIKDWKHFTLIVREFLQGKHSYKIIAVDTIGPLIKSCIRHCMDSLGLSHPSEGAYGSAYDRIKTEWNNTMHSLQVSPYGLWIVSHSVTKSIETVAGKRDYCEPNLPGFLQDFVVPNCDFIFLAMIRREKITEGKTITFVDKRRLHTKPTTNHKGKDRLRYAPLPDEVDLDAKTFKVLLQEHLNENARIAKEKK